MTLQVNQRTADVEFLGAPHDSDEACTLSVVRAGGCLLTGIKMRGPCQGQCVLPGGKEQFWTGSGGIGVRGGFAGAAIEVEQETGLVVPKDRWVPAGFLYVHDACGPETELQIQLSVADLDKQLPVHDSPELSDVQWTLEADLPYRDMPCDYGLWLPAVLSGYFVNMCLERDASEVAGTILYMSESRILHRNINDHSPTLDAFFNHLLLGFQQARAI